MLYGILGGCLWALDTVLLSLAMAPFSLEWTAPLISTAFHDLFSAGWMSGYATMTGRWTGIWNALHHKAGRQVLLAALLGGPVGMSGYVFAVHFLGPGLTAAISCFYPACAALIRFVFFKERLRTSQMTGMVLSLTCIALMSTGSMDSPSFGPGLVCAVLCVLGWSLEGVIIQHSMSESVDNGVALFLRQTLSASVFLGVLLPVSGAWRLAASILNVAGMGLVLAALAGTASYLCYYKAIGRIGAVKTMPLNSTYSAWTVLFSFLLEGTVPTVMQVVLCVGIIGGAVLCARESCRKEKEL